MPFQGQGGKKWRRLTQKKYAWLSSVLLTTFSCEPIFFAYFRYLLKLLVYSCYVTFSFSAGWIDCASTPIIALSIAYTYHPIPPSGDATQRLNDEPISTPDAEEMLLIPLRLTPLRPLRPKKFMKASTSAKDFDPLTLDSDVITVEIEIGPTILCVYGSLLRHFIHVKVRTL